MYPDSWPRSTWNCISLSKWSITHTDLAHILVIFHNDIVGLPSDDPWNTPQVPNHCRCTQKPPVILWFYIPWLPLPSDIFPILKKKTTWMSPAISSDFGLVFPNIFQHFPVELAVEFTLRWTFSVAYPSANLQMVTGFHIYLGILQYNISPTWSLAASGIIPLSNLSSRARSQWGRYNLPRSTLW